MFLQFIYNRFVNYFRFHLEKVNGDHVATDTVWAVWYFLCISHSLCKLTKPMFSVFMVSNWWSKGKITVEVCVCRLWLLSGLVMLKLPGWLTNLVFLLFKWWHCMLWVHTLVCGLISRTVLFFGLHFIHMVMDGYNIFTMNMVFIRAAMKRYKISGLARNSLMFSYVF